MPFSPHEFVPGTDKKLLDKLGTYEAELHPRIAWLGMGRFLLQHADNRIPRKEAKADFYDAFARIGDQLDRLNISSAQEACHRVAGEELTTGVFFVPYGTGRTMQEGEVRIIVNKTKNAPTGNDKIMAMYDYVLDRSKSRANVKSGSLELPHINPDLRPKKATDAPVAQLSHNGMHVVAHPKYVSPEPKDPDTFSWQNLAKFSGHMNHLAYLLSMLGEPTEEFIMPRSENQIDNPE